MDDTFSGMLKDFSEAFLAIASAVCLIIKTVRGGKHSEKSKHKPEK